MRRRIACDMSCASVVVISARGNEVTGEMDPGVDTRVPDQGGESALRDRRRRVHVADAGREREGGGTRRRGRTVGGEIHGRAIP
jgi:hypothetical protein